MVLHLMILAKHAPTTSRHLTSFRLHPPPPPPSPHPHRAQLLGHVEGEVVKIKRKWKSALEKNPADVVLDGDFVSQWAFVAELKDVGGDGSELFLKHLVWPQQQQLLLILLQPPRLPTTPYYN